MCFAIDPSTFGAGVNTRLESGIKRFKPHLIYDGVSDKLCGTALRLKWMDRNGAQIFVWRDRQGRAMCII